MTTVLALETSCDESAAAVVRRREGRLEVLAHGIASQVEEHAQWGGVVPEIASRRHVEALPRLVEAALDEAGVAFSDVDAVASTVAPGLVGALIQFCKHPVQPRSINGSAMAAVCQKGHVKQQWLDAGHSAGLQQAAVTVSRQKQSFPRAGHRQQSCLKQTRGTVHAIPTVISAIGRCRSPLTGHHSTLRF